MAVPFIKIYYTPSGGSQQDITEFTNLQNKRGLQIKDAKADITINNSKYRYKTGGASIFDENGTVDIYADYSAITGDTSQHILTGEIQEITHQYGEGGSQTKLTVADRTTLLLSSIWSKDYNGSPAFALDSLIKDVIKNAPNSASRPITTSNVAASNASGSLWSAVAATSNIIMAKNMKPIYEWITDLSQPTVTQDDKAYLFYVDKDNDFHWFYPSATVTGSIIEGSTTEIYSQSFKKSQDELINMLIYNAGADLYGNGILWYSFNSTSKSNKLRMKFQPMIDIGRDLFYGEIQAANVIATTTGEFPYQGLLYTNKAYSFTPAWRGATSVSSDSTYNDAFRTAAKLIANEKALGIMKSFAGLRWKGTLEIKGTNNYTAGDFLTIHLPTIGVLNQNMRVWDVAQSFGKDGWITTLELREDDEPISS